MAVVIVHSATPLVRASYQGGSLPKEGDARPVFGQLRVSVRVAVCMLSPRNRSMLHSPAEL